MKNISLIRILTVLFLISFSSGFFAQKYEISTAVPEYSQAFTNIIYKKADDTTTLKLDIYLPKKKAERFPVVVQIHGGGWVQGNKDIVKGNYIEKTVLRLLENGIAVVSADYRLTGKNVHFPAPAEDCKDVIRWIRKNASEYHLDADRIGLWGESAGGHLALLSAFTPDQQFPGDRALFPYSAKVNFVVDDYGPTELNQLMMTNAGKFKILLVKLFAPKLLNIRSKLIFALTGTSLDKQPEQVRKIFHHYSPLYYTENAVPVWINQGNKDNVVPMRQSEMLQKKLLEKNKICTLYTVKGAGHAFPDIDENTQNDLAEKITGFVLQYSLKGPEDQF